MKQDRGCVNDSLIPGRWEVGGYKMQRCPVASMDYGALIYLKAYRFMKHGILPNAGGWADQASKVCEALDFIDMKVRQKEQEDARDKH